MTVSEGLKMSLAVLTVVGVLAVTTLIFGWMIGIVCVVLCMVGLFLAGHK